MRRDKKVFVSVDRDELEKALYEAWFEGLSEAVRLTQLLDPLDYSPKQSWQDSETRRLFLSAFMPELMN
jgi:hypothetical protein